MTGDISWGICLMAGGHGTWNFHTGHTQWLDQRWKEKTNNWWWNEFLWSQFT